MTAQLIHLGVLQSESNSITFLDLRQKMRTYGALLPRGGSTRLPRGWFQSIYNPDIKKTLSYDALNPSPPKQSKYVQSIYIADFDICLLRIVGLLVHADAVLFGRSVLSRFALS